MLTNLDKYIDVPSKKISIAYISFLIAFTWVIFRFIFGYESPYMDFVGIITSVLLCTFVYKFIIYSRRNRKYYIKRVENIKKENLLNDLYKIFNFPRKRGEVLEHKKSLPEDCKLLLGETDAGFEYWISPYHETLQHFKKLNIIDDFDEEKREVNFNESFFKFLDKFFKGRKTG
jgi:hypothetical protein